MGGGHIYSERGYIFVAVVPHTVYPPCVGVMFAIRSCLLDILDGVRKKRFHGLPELQLLWILDW
jgi:hypothetical protein